MITIAEAKSEADFAMLKRKGAHDKQFYCFVQAANADAIAIASKAFNGLMLQDVGSGVLMERLYESDSLREPVMKGFFV